MKVFYLTLLLFSFQFGISQTGNLKVTIPNIEVVQGTIQIGLYNNADNFPKEEMEYKLVIVKVDAKEVSYTFQNLPQGEYAVALFHDENKDDICNRNFFGIPKEGYGFSNNIKPIISAPSFNETKFELNESKLVTIALIY